MKELIKNIYRNTIVDNGSSTNLKGEKAQNGYMISIKDCSIVEVNKFSVKVLEKIIKQNQDLLQKGNYLGTWIDNNKVYIDISTRLEKLDEALQLGIENKQLGIFDLNNMETIRI